MTGLESTDLDPQHRYRVVYLRWMIRGFSVQPGGMATQFVQRFLDHANLKTARRYLQIDQQGLHNALSS